MARADLLISLVRAATNGDQAQIRKTVEAMVAEERARHHEVFASQLEKQLGNGGPPRTEPVLARMSAVHDVLEEISPRKELSDLVLSSPVRRVIDELVQEHHRADLLRSYNLRPRNRVLLTGPPGNGKTSLAEALATALMYPMVIARYDGLITSFLGETASRLRRLFEFAHGRKCVLFFDEFDTLGKERGDIHETGEIKRVVSSLLLHVDDLPSHVVVVCATNHPELLDRAVWRRFQVRLELAKPSQVQIEEYFAMLQKRQNLNLGASPRVLAGKLRGASYSDLEAFLADIARTYVLTLPDADAKAITASRLKQWGQRCAAPRPRTRR